jgi:methionine biosynthesis protein MetW
MDVEAYYEQYWSLAGFHPQRRINPGLERLFVRNIPVGSKLVDVGCGNSSVCGLWFQQRGCDYLGVDVSEHAIAEARTSGLNVRKIDDASRLPYADETFDAAVCLEVLEHLFQPQIVASEILRVLKPQGILIATVPNAAYWRRRVELLFGRWNPLGDDLSIQQPWRDPHIRFFTRSRFSAMLLGVGFDQKEVGGHSSEYATLVRGARGLRKLYFTAHSSHFYRFLDRAGPALFAFRIHAVMSKPVPDRLDNPT